MFSWNWIVVMSTVVPSSFVGVGLFWQNEILIFARRPFHTVVFSWNWIVVVSTVVPSSFVDVGLFWQNKILIFTQDLPNLQQIHYLHQNLLLRLTSSNLQQLCHHLIFNRPSSSTPIILDGWWCYGEIRSWSCRLWHLHPLWVMSLLTKRDLHFCKTSLILQQIIFPH